MNENDKSNWIQGAIEHPGALKAKAKKAGAVNPDGSINKSWIRSKSKGDGRTARQAKLAMTLSKLRKRK